MLSKSEMETYISFMADSKEMVIFSSDPVWMRKLKKLCEEFPENYRVKEIGKYDGEELSVTVICQDKGLVTLRGKRRTLSEQEIAQRMNNLRAMRESDFEPDSLRSFGE